MFENPCMVIFEKNSLVSFLSKPRLVRTLLDFLFEGASGSTLWLFDIVIISVSGIFKKFFYNREI